MLQHNQDQLTRACLVVHRRFLEVAERIGELPEKSQRSIVPRLWQELQGFLSPQPDEGEELTIEACQWVNKMLEGIDRMIDIEGESLKAEAKLGTLGLTGIVESFSQRRHDRWGTTSQSR